MLSDLEIMRQAVENTYRQVDALTYSETALLILMREIDDLVLLRDAEEKELESILAEVTMQHEIDGV